VLAQHNIFKEARDGREGEFSCDQFEPKATRRSPYTFFAPFAALGSLRLNFFSS
jgi:hypothetical protein